MRRIKILITPIIALFLFSSCAPAESSSDGIEISDFGHLVAEEFLQQFVSLFELRLQAEDWMLDDGRYWPAWLHLEPCETAGDVPYIMDTGMMRLVAANFWLYDLNHNGIPDIVIDFWNTSMVASLLYSFVDGQFTAISGDMGIHRFFYDADGRMFALTGGGVRFFDDDGSIMDFDHSFAPDSSIDWGEQGLTQILPLTDLEDAIRQSVTTRLFP